MHEKCASITHVEDVIHHYFTLQFLLEIQSGEITTFAHLYPFLKLAAKLQTEMLSKLRSSPFDRPLNWMNDINSGVLENSGQIYVIESQMNKRNV